MIRSKAGLAGHVVALLLAVAFAASARDDIRTERVHFKPGATSTAIEGSIKGFAIVDYLVGAREGQQMNVSLATGHTATFFNILAPGETEVAMFNGSTSENQYEGRLPRSGDYRIRVYTMRSDARRDETANYRLEIIITGAGAHASGPHGDAKVAGTDFHATGDIPCSMGGGQPTGSCAFGVTRAGGGSGTVRVKVGYPDTWRDYSKLEIEPGDAYGNRVRSARFDWDRLVSRIDGKTDRDEWGMGPQTVNAYYNPKFNEIVFPAAILQPPYFDPHADPAINYGGIGAVIGHEMGHGYDDQGAKSDERGVLRSWWKPEDEERFRAKTRALAAQFSTYSPVPGLHINGDFTSGENIGDLGGTAVALEAYRISLKGQTPPVLDGFTGEQRFYLGWAQVWRSVAREEYLRLVTTSDFHSPDEFRVNGIVRNMDGWYDAFQVAPGDKLYLKPEERVRIW